MDRDRKEQPADRDRLKEVHATDLTESRINEDFVDWMKTKGSSWLLVALVAIVGYLGWIKWKQRASERVSVAWTELSGAGVPLSKIGVARNEEFAEIFAVPELARQAAAAQYLDAVQRNLPIEAAALLDGTTPPDPNAPRLTVEERAEYLASAEEYLQELSARDDGSRGMTLHAVRALTGRAAVAECRGQIEQARTYWEQAAARCETVYPTLAQRIRKRVDDVDRLAQPIELGGSLAAATPPLPIAPATIVPALRPFLQPDAPAPGSPATTLGGSRSTSIPVRSPSVPPRR